RPTRERKHARVFAFCTEEMGGGNRTPQRAGLALGRGGGSSPPLLRPAWPRERERGVAAQKPSAHGHRTRRAVVLSMHHAGSFQRSSGDANNKTGRSCAMQINLKCSWKPSNK
ncbi:hypothetical protein JRQ81_010607, partial [Phrynocephalus forsythii]